MWPVSYAEVADACGVGVIAENLRSALLTGSTTDSRSLCSGDLFVAVVGEKFDGHDYVAGAFAQGAAAALISDSWPGFVGLPAFAQERCLRVDNPIEAFRRLARFFRSRLPCPVVGIGGSNGKTTAKEMLAAMLGGGRYVVAKTEKSENGFLGIALTLCRRDFAVCSHPHATVLEIGIDEVGAMEKHLEVVSPDIALLTALGPEHLNGLGSWDKAVEEELILFSARSLRARVWQGDEPRLRNELLGTYGVRPGDMVVCAETSLRSAPEVCAAVARAGVGFLAFSVRNGGLTSSEVDVRWKLPGGLAESRETSLVVPLPGAHNVTNFLLALATSLVMGRSMREIHDGLRGFRAPPMRSRVEYLNHDAVLIDDCYNASPASMEAAVALLNAAEWRGRKKVLVLGDMLDLGQESRNWHLSLLKLLEPVENSHLFLYGDAMYDLFIQLEQFSSTAQRGLLSVEHLPTHENPVGLLARILALIPGAVVLVKGSRGMGLDRVVSRLKEEVGLELG